MRKIIQYYILTKNMQELHTSKTCFLVTAHLLKASSHACLSLIMNDAASSSSFILSTSLSCFLCFAFSCSQPSYASFAACAFSALSSLTVDDCNFLFSRYSSFFAFNHAFLFEYKRACNQRCMEYIQQI